MNKLKSFRMQQGITQKELSERSGVSRITIARMETGYMHANMATAYKVAKALEISVADLIGEPFGQAEGTGQTASAPRDAKI